MKNTRIRRAGAGFTGFGIVAVAAVLAATSANASVFTLKATGPNQVGAADTLTVDVGGNAPTTTMPVTFTDNGTLIGTAVPATGADGFWHATIQWTPQTSGTHVLVAEQRTSDNIAPTVQISVDVAAAPVTPPSHTGTGSASSIPVIGPLLSSLSG